MSRPADWAPLAASDPLPGDPVAIQRVSRDYAAFADNLSGQAQTLRNVTSSGDWDSDAGREFASSAGDLADQLRKAERSYAAVGQALNEYAHSLSEAQARGEAALREAQAIAASQSHSSGASTSAGSTYAPITSPLSAVPDLALDAAVREPAGRLHAAVADRDVAARRAASRIQDAAAHAGLKDSWWSKVTHSISTWAHEHAELLEKITTWSGRISSALAWIAIGLSFIPGLDVAAPIFLAGSFVFALTATASEGLLMMGGDGSMIDLGFDLVSVATIGYGFTAGKFAEGAENIAAGRLNTLVRQDAEADALPKAEAGIRAALARKAAAAGTDDAGRPAGTLTRAERAAALRELPGPRNLKLAAHADPDVVQRIAGKAAAKAGQRAAARTAEEVEAQHATLFQKLTNLDGQNAATSARLAKMMTMAPTNPGVQAAGERAVRLLNRAAAANLTGATSDAVEKSHELLIMLRHTSPAPELAAVS